MSLLKENDGIRKLLNVDKWHTNNYNGNNVTVVILDSSEGKPLKGMESYYTDVFGKAIKSGHPVNVAQTVNQISQNCKILYFDNTRNKDAVFDWVKNHVQEIDIVNISLAGLRGMPTEDYLRYKELDLVICAASGNDYYEDHISYPAKYPFVISVGATNKIGTIVDSYSNKDPSLITTCPSHMYVKNIYGEIHSVSGTSFSSPVAVGLLAIYIEWRKKNNLPKLTPDEAMKFVKNNCVDIEDVGRDNKSGYGLFVLPDLEDLEKTLKQKEPEIIIPNPDSTPKKLWRCQANAFSQKSNAEAYQQVLKVKGYNSYIVFVNGLYKCQLNAFSLEANARMFSQKLKNEGINNFIVYY